jgi:hypothetical protein
MPLIKAFHLRFWHRRETEMTGSVNRFDNQPR